MGKEKVPAFSKEVQEVISVVNAGQRQDLIILLIPSSDQHNKDLADQDMWAREALALFADLYGGATAFKTFKGIYKVEETGKILEDEPILIESYVARIKLIDSARLQRLLTFIKRMGHETDQYSVALIINDTFHEIQDFG